LGLTATAIAIIKDARGVTIDPKATNFRQVKEKENFKRREKRLAQNAEWRPTGTAFDVA
jgi:hypothetical protein